MQPIHNIKWKDRVWMDANELGYIQNKMQKYFRITKSGAYVSVYLWGGGGSINYPTFRAQMILNIVRAEGGGDKIDDELCSLSVLAPSKSLRSKHAHSLQKVRKEKLQWYA